MKVLYAIQGTGNGHLSRARDIIPALMKYHEVDVLVSGTQADIELPFPIKYHYQGMSFVFGSNGGVDVFETYKKSKIKLFLSEINSLPVELYDLVINDFEPVSAWACKLRKVKCISLSHQSAVLAKNAIRPGKIDLVGLAILKNYAPASASYGFHFLRYDDHIFTPVIRRQVREYPSESKGHYTVYLPAYADDRILKVLRNCTTATWQVFSKHNKQVIREKNISIQPISNEAFIESMATSEGVLCGAGFETPAEALYLKKKLMVIPMKGQYEQQCNAAALKSMGVPVLKSLKLKHTGKINNWVENGEFIPVDYPDCTDEIIRELFQLHVPAVQSRQEERKIKPYSVKKFRSIILRKLAAQI